MHSASSGGKTQSEERDSKKGDTMRIYPGCLRIGVGAVLACCILSQAVAGDGSADKKTDSARTNRFRVSAIEGMKVLNGSGESIGKVNDVVVDFNTGNVVYAALDYGGFIGIGDKLFAVPWSAFKVQSTAKDQHLMLSIPKETLADAPGFNKSHWPEMTDAAWPAVDKYYATASRNSTAAPDNRSADKKTDSARTHHFRASAIEGMKVVNGSGEKLGKINDLVVDLNTGKIAYAALDFGGFIGIGDKLFAVPFKAFQCVTDADGQHLVLAIPKDKLEKAPGFDAKHWPAAGNSSWLEVDQYYGPVTKR